MNFVSLVILKISPKIKAFFIGTVALIAAGLVVFGICHSKSGNDVDGGAVQDPAPAVQEVAAPAEEAQEAGRNAYDIFEREYIFGKAYEYIFGNIYEQPEAAPAAQEEYLPISYVQALGLPKGDTSSFNEDPSEGEQL